MSGPQNGKYKFFARMDYIKTFAIGIKAINFNEHHSGFIRISESAIRITTEIADSVQANLYLQKSCFSEYHVDSVVSFSIKLFPISECLNIFTGINCRLKSYYQGENSPFTIVLEPYDEENVTTECSIKTKYNEEPLSYCLDEKSSSYNVIFMRGPDLSDIFNELDKSAEEVRITISPRSPNFKIDTLGVMHSESSVEVSKTSDMMLLFNCREATTARYRWYQLRMIQKALSAASKVGIKTDSSGLLELYFMIQSCEKGEVCIQSFVLPLNEEID